MRILLTGGSSDIGREFAIHRFNEGDEVFLTASNNKSLQSNKDYFKKKNISINHILFNFSSPEESTESIQDIFNSGGLDALILNAWSRNNILKRFHNENFLETKEYLEKNLFGNMWLIHTVLPHMVENKFGRIIFISSISTEIGTGRYAKYIIGKSALEGLVKNLAVDYGKYNILSNTIKLGLFKTSRTENFWKDETYQQKIGSIIPQDTMGLPEQAASAISIFLKDNQYINGAELHISGGLPMFRFEGVLK